MSLETLRADIRTWLEQFVKVQKWDLDEPSNAPRVIEGQRYPANAAIEFPIERLTVQNAEGRTLAVALLPYAVSWRFKAEASLNQLPIAQAENLLMFLAFESVTNFTEMSPLIESAQILNNENPVRVSRVAGEDSDWLISIYFEIEATFAVDYNGISTILEPATPPYEGFTATSIKLGVNRSLVEFADPNDEDDYVTDAVFDLDVLLGE